jgi:glycosyltransferase involved in cell wall biosynthesis
MKILFLIPDLAMGGCQKHLVEIVKVMALQENFQLAIATMYDSNHFEEQIPNNVLLFSGKKPKHKLGRLIGFLRILRWSAKFQPDLINAFLGFGVNYGIYLKFALKLRHPKHTIKLVASFRVKVGVIRDFSYYFRKVLYNIFLSQINSITYNYPEGPLDGQKTYGFAPLQCHYIFNGINILEYEKFEKRQTGGMFNFIYPGRFVEQKNHKAIIFAVDRIKREFPEENNFRIILCGDQSDKKVFNNVLHLIEQLGLESFFEISGPVKNIIELYSQSSALLSTSLYEGFPNVLLEAWACKLPVLVSKEMDTLGLVINYENGIDFSVSSDQNLAVKICEFVNLSKTDLQKMGENGFKLVSNNYSLISEVSLFTDIYSAS